MGYILLWPNQEVVIPMIKLQKVPIATAIPLNLDLSISHVLIVRISATFGLGAEQAFQLFKASVECC